MSKPKMRGTREPVGPATYREWNATHGLGFEPAKSGAVTRLWHSALRRKRLPWVRIKFEDGGEFIARVDAIHWDRWFGVTLRETG